MYACKLYPAGATTNADSGVTDIRRIDAVLARMSEARPAAFGARRGDRAPCRRVRSRNPFHRRSAGADGRAIPEAARGVRTHHHEARAAEFVKARARRRRRHDHAPAPAAQSQRHLRGRHPAALLLPADPQDRAGSRSAARGRDERQSAVLPRHRQRAARASTPRKTPAVAPACSPRTRASSCMPKRSSPSGKLDQLEGFASDFGADFYRLPRNSETITLAKREWRPPANYPDG